MVFVEGIYIKDGGGIGFYVGVFFGVVNDDDIICQLVVMVVGVVLMFYVVFFEEVVVGFVSVVVKIVLVNGEVVVVDDLLVIYIVVSGYEGFDSVVLELIYVDGLVVIQELEFEVFVDMVIVSVMLVLVDVDVVEVGDDVVIDLDVVQVGDLVGFVVVIGVVIIGDDGDNILIGIDGDDLLIGGFGVDMFIGGVGVDIFVLILLVDVDLIIDYSFGEGDKIDFGQLLDGVFGVGEVVVDLVQVSCDMDGGVIFRVDQDGCGVGYDWQDVVKLVDYQLMGDMVCVVMDNVGIEVDVQIV